MVVGMRTLRPRNPPWLAGRGRAVMRSVPLDCGLFAAPAPSSVGCATDAGSHFVHPCRAKAWRSPRHPCHPRLAAAAVVYLSGNCRPQIDDCLPEPSQGPLLIDAAHPCRQAVRLHDGLQDAACRFPLAFQASDASCTSGRTSGRHDHGRCGSQPAASRRRAVRRSAVPTIPAMRLTASAQAASASARRSWPASRRARLMAARSSQDTAPCSCAIDMARHRHDSAFVLSGTERAASSPPRMRSSSGRRKRSPLARSRPACRAARQGRAGGLSGRENAPQARSCITRG